MTTLKNFTMTSYQEIVTSLSFTRYIPSLEQSGSQILDAWSVIITFALKVTFDLTKTKNRTKKSLTQLSYYFFE